MPNTHRRRRRDATVELSRVGVGGVYCWAYNCIYLYSVLEWIKSILEIFILQKCVLWNEVSVRSVAFKPLFKNALVNMDTN